MTEDKKNALVTLPEAILSRLDIEAASEKRSRSGQLEMILRDRYTLPTVAVSTSVNDKSSGKRQRATT